MKVLEYTHFLKGLAMRRILLCFLFIAFIVPSGKSAQSEDLRTLLPTSGRKALEIPYFPNRMCTFIWRNWNLVPIDRLAKTIKTDESKIVEIANLMGLPPSKEPTWPLAQNYITIVRRNWHLLPYEQLLILLDMTPEKFAFHLKEDDFLYYKVGGFKPQCEPLFYNDLTAAESHNLLRLSKITSKRLATFLSRQKSRDSILSKN